MNTRKLLSSIGTAAILFGVVVSSHAISHTIIDTQSHIIAPGTTYTGSFDLLSSSVNPAYDPAAEVITSARATFILAEQFGIPGNESVTVDLEGSFFGSAQNFFIAGISAEVNLTLLDDNLLQFSISSGSGSFVPTVLAFAGLEFNTAPRTQAVPDGGATLGLLGLTLLGLSWAGRRWRA